VKISFVNVLGAQAFLLALEAGAQRSIELGNRMWRDRLRDKIMKSTRIIMGYNIILDNTDKKDANLLYLCEILNVA